MKKFSFLNYLDDYSDDNLRTVMNQSGFRSQAEFAIYVGLSKDTLKSWFVTKEGSKRKNQPSAQMWNYVLCQLEARHKGYKTLEELIKQSAIKA